MSAAAGPIQLTLLSWAESRLQTLLESSSQADFDQAFDNFFAHKVHLNVNGKELSRDAYKKQLFGDQSREHTLNIVFQGSLEVPKDINNVLEGGEVGLIFHATIHFNKVIIGQPVTNTVDASLNLIIEPDNYVLPGATDIDRRRVTKLNQISKVSSGIIPL